MKRILLIEDEPLNATRLSAMLKEYDSSFLIDGPLQNAAEIRDTFAKKNDYDLILSDIRLQDNDVFDVLEELDICTPVIFTTAYEEYALKAYKHNGIAYLLKPIAREELSKALDNVYQLHSDETATDVDGQKYRERFLISKGKELIPVNVEDMLYLKRKDRYTLVCLNDGSILNLNYSINKLEGLLSPESFFRINRQYIICLNSVMSIQTDVNSKLIVKLRHCDEDIVISRERALAFREWIEG